jgi:hypothetical protein
VRPRRTWQKLVAELSNRVAELEKKVAYRDKRIVKLIGEAMKKGSGKVAKVMGEFKSGSLHSGSKKGPIVTKPSQAKAIALDEARKAGAKIPKKGK